MSKYHKGKEACDCKEQPILWEWIDDNTIKILGVKGQDYEVGFNYVYLKCKSCGKIVYKNSSTADGLRDMAEEANKFPLLASTAVVPGCYKLNTCDRNILLSKLSTKQKEIYRFLAEQAFYHQIEVEEISKKVGLSKDRVLRHIEAIEKEIKKINPNFGKFKYTKTVVLPATNKDELANLRKKLEGILDKEFGKE